MQKTIKQRFFIIAGTFFLALGVIGVVIPVLPTTPFLLLTAGCYARGSGRLHKWLLGNRFFGKYLLNYLKHKSVPVRVKIFAITILWTGIGLTAAFGVEHIAVRIILVLIAIAVTLHIVMLNSRNRCETEHDEGRKPA